MLEKIGRIGEGVKRKLLKIFIKFLLKKHLGRFRPCRNSHSFVSFVNMSVFQEGKKWHVDSKRAHEPVFYSTHNIRLQIPCTTLHHLWKTTIFVCGFFFFFCYPGHSKFWWWFLSVRHLKYAWISPCFGQ